MTKSDDRLVEGPRKVQSLASNAEALRLPNWLTDAQKQFSAVSHVGPLTLSLRINLALREAVLFGGLFDPERLSWYRSSL
ncbi:hypothetical protein K7N18_30140 [Burkholderia arboris]|uniref:hypothetical protein n=1 Tax=Burkholderia arboris TaxID=488730 RepID=UPI001CA447BF|nr:hypothetical protein [Burkholderia arboris]MBY8609088.1 hypothetical protein [Burkholderia arboris]